MMEQFQKMRTTDGKVITYKGVGKGSRERKGVDKEAYRNSPLWEKMGPQHANDKTREEK